MALINSICMCMMPTKPVQGHEQEGSKEEMQEGAHDDSYHPEDHAHHQASSHQKRMAEFALRMEYCATTISLNIYTNAPSYGPKF